MKKQFSIPNFKSEVEEREFWSKVDLVDNFSAKDSERVSFPNI